MSPMIAYVHSDFPIDIDEMVEHNPCYNYRNIGEQIAKVRSGEAKGYTFLNFWRPTVPMVGPIKQWPLAFCDPNTVKTTDIITNDLLESLPGNNRFLHLKFHED